MAISERIEPLPSGAVHELGIAAPATVHLPVLHVRSRPVERLGAALEPPCSACLRRWPYSPARSPHPRGYTNVNTTFPYIWKRRDVASSMFNIRVQPRD
jgi:hypothetical protein